jgi:hypothetical protein
MKEVEGRAWVSVSFWGWFWAEVEDDIVWVDLAWRLYLIVKKLSEDEVGK